MKTSREDATEYNAHLEQGFLAYPDPLIGLPDEFAQWEEIGRNLPKLLAAGAVRPALAGLAVVNVAKLGDDVRKWRRAHQIFAYLAHAEVFGGKEVKSSISRGVAIPLCTSAQHLGIPPLLSYAAYALWNWRRLDTAKPVVLGNIALIQNFLGGLDEEWFILVHVDIEAKAAPALSSISAAQRATHNKDSRGLQAALAQVAATMRTVNKTFARMPEGCDPYIYYHRVRPYIHGWKNNPALPEGVVYEGVSAWNGNPQKFYGETGAQSSIIPALNRFYGIEFTEDDLTAYERELVQYMPPEHRMFLSAVEHGPSVRAYLQRPGHSAMTLRNTYNEGIEQIAEFLQQHMEYAGGYIHKQSQTSSANPSAIGTGGSPFMRYLKKHLDETLAHRL